MSSERVPGDRQAPARTHLDGFVPYAPELVAEYTRRGWWTGETFVDVFERAARRGPEREALVDAHRRLTWTALEAEVAVLARALRDRGIGRHDRVLLQLPNRSEYIVAFHAVQRLAAVPVVAVPRMGPAELRSLLDLTEPAAWLLPLRDGSRDAADVLGAVGRRPELVVTVGDDTPAPAGTVPYVELAAEPDRARRLGAAGTFGRPDPDDVAVIFLTGAVTGRSKAVPRTHNSILGTMRLVHRVASADDVFVNCTPVGHGMANQGPLGGWLINAGRLVMVGRPRARDILEAVSRERATRLMLVPALLADLLDDPDLDRFDLRSLRFVASTSSHLNPDVALRAYEFFGSFGCRFGGSNYGSTEGPACGHAPDEPLDRRLRTVGRPTAPGHRWVVLGPDGREQPPGQAGEIAVRGPSVFTGYYRSPADSARIFTDDGFFRTGDTGLIDAEGYVHLTGRLKDVIQRGGEAVLPVEIEELLSRHPAVARVAVVAMPDVRLGERACAYVVAVPGAEPSLDDLVDFLRARGAGPLQWPERLELTPALPETPAGKLDRAALRADAARKVAGFGESR